MVYKNLFTYSDSGQKTLRDVGNNDTDEENDSLQPEISQDEGNDEEGDTEENSHSGDDVDEMGNLLGNRGLIDLQTRGQVSNTSHHRVVTDLHNNATAGT